MKDDHRRIKRLPVVDPQQVYEAIAVILCVKVVIVIDLLCFYYFTNTLTLFTIQKEKGKKKTFETDRSITGN